MALPSAGPPGPPRPKSSPSLPSTNPSQPRIFAPSPTQPRTSWFNLLSSSPGPIPFPLPPAASVDLPSTQPHAGLASSTSCLQSLHPAIKNNTEITNLATTASLSTLPNNDPWTRAHVRVCAHALDSCAACSIALVCCSCRALRFTPGLPPASPPPLPVHVHNVSAATQRSRSASPALFRDLGNPPTPPFLDNWLDTCDDDAYSRALAEFDTCENSSCPRGDNELASWTITVEQFDDGLEEFFDRTFRACTACNRSCKRSFLGHKIKSRSFDNSSKAALAHPNDSAKPSLTSDSFATSPDNDGESRPVTPLAVYANVARAHHRACNHVFSACSTCSRGITCCGCNALHTAPARLKLRCATCLHYACGTCTTPFCCSCRKPWFPTDSPTIVLSSRLRGGARSTKSSKKGSDSSSQSSGPGSLATAISDRESPNPFTAAAAPLAPGVTQSSTDEIDAFADTTVRLPIASAPIRSGNAPSPSSNLPPASSPVFIRPAPQTGLAEDVPTVVPSHAPSHAASVASAASTGDAGIADLLQAHPSPISDDPPALADVFGRIHRRFPLASLKVDDTDPRHFLARDNTQVDDIANETDYLLTSNTSWPSLLYFVRDTMKFESIHGSMSDFQVFLGGLTQIWSGITDFDAKELWHNMLEAHRLFPKAEKEIDRLEAVSLQYRSERQAARTQLKTTKTELSRLRQAANDTLDSNARLLTEIDQLRATDAVAAIRERDESRSALKDTIALSKAAMAKQTSRYKQLAEIADKREARIRELEKEAEEKDAYVLKTEQERAELYRECEAAERLVSSTKQQLHDATNLFETAREARRHDQEDFDERSTAFKARIAELTARLDFLPAGEAELRSLVTDANERAGIAKEEYRKKSAELKATLKELKSLKDKQQDTTKSQDTDKAKRNKAAAKESTGASKKVCWSFEPEDDSSQPFWDHANEYSRYIANMVAATIFFFFFF